MKNPFSSSQEPQKALGLRHEGSQASGQLDLKMRLEEVRRCVRDGADEIDMVINRGAFLSGDYQTVFNTIKSILQSNSNQKTTYYFLPYR